MMHFLIVSSNFKFSPRHIRKQFSFQGDNLDISLSTLLSHEAIKEAAIFSNREMIEIYAVATRYETALEKIKALLNSCHDRNLGDVEEFIYAYKDVSAIRHLFYVAFGFESLRVDDTDILMQFTNAIKYSINRHTDANLLRKMIEKINTLSESQEIQRIRTQHASYRTSISFAAKKLAKKMFDNFTELNLLLIGSGTMAEDAAKSLINMGIRELVVINESFEAACKKADELYGRAVAIDNLSGELSAADIIICSTDFPSYIISKDQVSDHMRERIQRPVFIIDISVPRNVDPAINDIDNVYLYDVDNLISIIDESANSYAERNNQIQTIIEKEVELLWLEVMSK